MTQATTLLEDLRTRADAVKRMALDSEESKARATEAERRERELLAEKNGRDAAHKLFIDLPSGLQHEADLGSYHAVIPLMRENSLASRTERNTLRQLLSDFPVQWEIISGDHTVMELDCDMRTVGVNFRTTNYALLLWWGDNRPQVNIDT